MNPVIRQRLALPSISFQRQSKKINEHDLSLFSHIFHRIHVFPKLGISLVMVRIMRIGKLLDCDRGKQDDFSPGMSPFHFVEVPVQVALKFGQSRIPAKRFVHPESQDQKIRRPLGQQFLQMINVTLRPQTVAHLITRPGQTPEFKFLVGIGQLQASLESTVLLQTLDKGISVQEDTVTLLELKLRMDLESQQTRPCREENPAHWKIFPLSED